MRVETGRGAMAVDGLGTTLMHEQVFVLTPDVEWILRAVGQTHVETGTPITVHTSAALKTGLIAQRILKEEGVDLTKVESATAVIRPTSTTYARSPTRARRSAWTVSHRRVLAVRGPRHHGRGAGEGRLRGLDGAGARCVLLQRLLQRSYKAALLPRWNYTHITDDVLPTLREHGVDEAQITAMLVHNPARYFTGGQE